MQVIARASKGPGAPRVCASSPRIDFGGRSNNHVQQAFYVKMVRKLFRFAFRGTSII